ncbi:MAG TPA: bifunctional phosphoribosylaminoimidazolecarboxamide formyltransferase/IMP cyclohydrolase [Candidatus Limnocylindrales bacterium]|nr:bifunctional phosphoribosylaminoimidazolecarboxamide formyltransferase/IMP cyclohydrolase [Candidatus Limnocylindrales bacterium]
MRALFSVASRDGIAQFARELQSLGVEIFATDGTRDHLAAEGVTVASVAELTNAPALVGGQVRTFHPAVYAGILARRDVPEQLAELGLNGMAPIDLVAVNVKPFAPAVGARLIGVDEAIEMIDVAGVALLSAAARNAAGVAAIADPAHYPTVVEELRALGGLSAELRTRLAAESFGVVAAYHAEIAAYLNQLSGNQFPNRLAMVLEKVSDVRYGENPHQRAAFYRETTHRSGTLADAAQVQGASPSFNDLLDLDAAYRIARDYTAPTVAIVKHTDPVGLASADALADAYRRALETDPVAAFGGIVGVNRTLDRATADEIAANSYEAVVAPGFSDDALRVLRDKSTLELLAVPPDPIEGMRDYGIANLDFKRVAGGLLVESLDTLGLDRGQLQVVTHRRPTLEELTDLLFAWRAVRHVRSNAIVLARNAATVGIGAAQASRTVSVEIALRRAGDRARFAVMASDAYFPFPDGIALAAQAGVTAIIQPGGSIRDEMAIEVADRHHLAMVFTGRRHFRH